MRVDNRSLNNRLSDIDFISMKKLVIIRQHATFHSDTMRIILKMTSAEIRHNVRFLPLSIVLLLPLILLLHCEGPTGPQGPPGAANITVKTFTIEDTTDIQINGLFGYYDYEMDAITQAVVDSGIVLGYLGDQNQTAWAPLPYDIDIDIENDFTVNYTLSVGFEYRVGLFSITYIASADTLFRPSLPLGPFKVAVVPPSQMGRLGKVDLAPELGRERAKE